MTKVLKMLALHEIGEVIIGDITPFDNVSEEEKLNILHKANTQEIISIKKN